MRRSDDSAPTLLHRCVVCCGRRHIFHFESDRETTGTQRSTSLLPAPFHSVSIHFPPTRMISTRLLISTNIGTCLSWIQVSMSTIMSLMNTSCVPRDRRSRGVGRTAQDDLQTTDLSKTLCLAYTLLTTMDPANMHVLCHRGKGTWSPLQLHPTSASSRLIHPFLCEFFPGKLRPLHGRAR